MKMPATDGEWWLADGLGRTVFRQRVQRGAVLEIATDDLPAGLYFWRLTGGGRLVRQGKVVVSK